MVSLEEGHHAQVGETPGDLRRIVEFSTDFECLAVVALGPVVIPASGVGVAHGILAVGDTRLILFKAIELEGLEGELAAAIVLSGEVQNGGALPDELGPLATGSLGHLREVSLLVGTVGFLRPDREPQDIAQVLPGVRLTCRLVPGGSHDLEGAPVMMRCGVQRQAAPAVFPRTERKVDGLPAAAGRVKVRREFGGYALDSLSSVSGEVACKLLMHARAPPWIILSQTVIERVPEEAVGYPVGQSGSRGLLADDDLPCHESVEGAIELLAAMAGQPLHGPAVQRPAGDGQTIQDLPAGTGIIPYASEGGLLKACRQAEPGREISQKAPAAIGIPAQRVAGDEGLHRFADEVGIPACRLEDEVDDIRRWLGRVQERGDKPGGLLPIQGLQLERA
jgi:hypothetical protein